MTGRGVILITLVILGVVTAIGWFSFGPYPVPASGYATEQLPADLVVLPTSSRWATDVRAPLAWILSKGKGVHAGVVWPLSVAHPADLSPFVDIAPQALTTLLRIDRTGAETAVDHLRDLGIKVAIIPDISFFEDASVETLVKGSIDAGIPVVVGVGGNAGERTVTRAESLGAITVGGYDWMGVVHEPAFAKVPPDLTTLGEGNPVISALMGGAVVALLTAREPQLTPKEIKHRLIKSGVPVWQLRSPDGHPSQFRRTTDGHTLPRWTFFHSPFTYRRLDAPRALGIDLQSPWFYSALGLPKAHKIARGTGRILAVVDFGFIPTHPMMRNVVTDAVVFGGGAFEEHVHPHGTRMAEIAHAVAPGASILALVRPLTKNPAELSRQTAAAIRYAASQHADVISISLEGDDSPAVNSAIDDAMFHPKLPDWWLSSGSVIPSGLHSKSRNTYKKPVPGCETAASSQTSSRQWSDSSLEYQAFKLSDLRLK